MADIPITIIRCSDAQARDRLTTYVFGGYRVGPRVPRGIEPASVSRIIAEELTADAPPDAYAKAVETLRFYETADCLPQLRRVLTGKEADRADLLRAAYAVQAVAEVGTTDEGGEVAEYFDTHLAGHAKAVDAVNTLLETLVVLSPEGTPDRLSERIAKEVSAREGARDKDEQGMRAYQEIAAIQSMKLPQTLELVNGKKRLIGAEPAERRPELVDLYLGLSPLSDALMITWAGRMLRREAREQDPEPVRTAFAKKIAEADPEQIGKDPLTDTIVNRAAQAIIYLGGTLTKEERQRYENTKRAAMNFLWDDL